MLLTTESDRADYPRIDHYGSTDNQKLLTPAQSTGYVPPIYTRRALCKNFHLCSLPSHSSPSQSPQLDSKSPATCLSKSPLRQKPNIAAAIVTLSRNALPRPLYVCDDPSNTPKFSGYCTGVTSRATSQDPSAAAPDTLVMTRATRQES
ncbi:hypothetical protein PGT21_030229 [Puccinia graminis f. sp. tritici]|uniref:Uncharacterized protein n=1 Tax=Puccinia graminis f. sp. tritici TaxID=56615 RepID=A0A5B0QC60_PUCGR|nr:hypothetical protein PGT21_030229 [Puccinia graminis f. sp. tritici]KAA1139219.1 hypothetical protein PGTUg99_037398 [Puccinia graminis f. sp. tritici]